MQHTYSIVIIGCGPAGIATSLFLSRSGIPHLILEKEIYPRDKVCGDGCSGKTTFVLRKFQPEILQEIFSDSAHFMPSHGILFSAPNGNEIEVPYLPRKGQADAFPPGFTTRRLVLDHFLFNKIDKNFATIQQQATVQHIQRLKQGFEITYLKDGRAFTIQADCIIGADGDKGITRKSFFHQEKVARTAYVGLRGYYRNVHGMHDRQFIELHFLKDLLPGYFWIFPLPDNTANVGVCMPSDVVRKKKINLREQMQQIISSHPLFRARFKEAACEGKILGWGLPMSKGAARVSDDRILFAGDAASLIDPFSGEGVGNALYSGMLAAEAVKKAIVAGCFDAVFLKSCYDDVLFSKIGNELKLSCTMQRLVRYPRLFNLVVNKAAKSPSLQQTISSMFADLDVRALLRKPSFYWKILMNR